MCSLEYHLQERQPSVSKIIGWLWLIYQYSSHMKKIGKRILKYCWRNSNLLTMWAIIRFWRKWQEDNWGFATPLRKILINCFLCKWKFLETGDMPTSSYKKKKGCPTYTRFRNVSIESGTCFWEAQVALIMLGVLLKGSPRSTGALEALVTGRKPVATVQTSLSWKTNFTW